MSADLTPLEEAQANEWAWRRVVDFWGVGKPYDITLSNPAFRRGVELLEQIEPGAAAEFARSEAARLKREGLKP